MSWYNSDFKRRLPLVIDTSTTAKGTIEFSFVVPEDYDDFWNNVRTDGFDVVLADKNGEAFTFQRFTWNATTRSSLFRVAGFSMTEGNVMHVIYIYWDNPDQSTDLSSSVTTTTPKTTFAYLGAPFGNVVNFQTRSGLSTVPTTIFQKDPDEKIDIWFPISQLLAPRALPYNERLDFKGLDYIDVNVLDSLDANQTAMYALGETRIISGWVRARIQAGSDNTDYVVRIKVFTSDNEVFILSCLLQVRKLLPT